MKFRLILLRDMLASLEVRHPGDAFGFRAAEVGDVVARLRAEVEDVGEVALVARKANLPKHPI